MRRIFLIILTLASALTLFLALDGSANICLDLAWYISIVICKFFFLIILFLVLSHICDTFIEYHILPEAHIDLVLITGSKNKIGIV